MPLILKCLCRKNSASCTDCAARVRLQWNVFAAEKSKATPGQLIGQAIEENRIEVVLGILQNTEFNCNQICDPQRSESASPFMTALQADNLRMAALISCRPDFDLKRSLPDFETWRWVRSSSLELLRQYLDIPGGNINDQDGNGKTLLHEVVYDLDGRDKLLYLLSRPDIDIDIKQTDGKTPLYHAVLAGNDKAFETLLDYGADVNTCNNDNRWTILICAVAENRIISSARLLLHDELKVNAEDDNKNTALHIASERGHSHIVELLLQHPKIQINCKNHIGWTPLGKAAFNGHVKVVRRLLERPDLEVNFVDQHRNTPLFHAVSAGNLEIVRLLLADPRTNTAITDRPDRHTALDMASALGFTDIMQLIRQVDGSSDELSANDSYIELNGETGKEKDLPDGNASMKERKPIID
jgi:ankyrin repeat protein